MCNKIVDCWYKKKKINDVVKAIKNFDNCFEYDAPTKKEIQDTLSCVGMRIIPTENYIHINYSSGGLKDSRGYTNSERTSNSQISFKNALQARDNGKCRVHDEKCPSDDIQAGHIWPISVQTKDVPQDFVAICIINDSQNGYLWCKQIEECYGRFLFCIDYKTGVAAWAPEFPYKYCNIDPSVQYKVGRFNDLNPQNYAYLNEPKPLLLQAYHDHIYIPERMKMIQEAIQNPYACLNCGKRFTQEASLKQHSRTCGTNGDAVGVAIIDIKKPSCTCTTCNNKKD